MREEWREMEKVREEGQGGKDGGGGRVKGRRHER